MSQEERKERIREFCRKKEEEKYGKGKRSSEDVWKMREVRVDGAFEGDFRAYEQEIREQEKETSEKDAIGGAGT